MEMEGRGYSDLYRNTTEELFINTMMESSMGMQAPTMEMLGFKNLSQSYRADSGELCKNWLNTNENNSVSHRTRQSSKRISSETGNLSSQQQTGLNQRKRSNEILIQESSSMVGESSTGPNHHLNNNAAEKGLLASNSFLPKAWLNSTQPMTRSRSSELRRRYTSLQNVNPQNNVEAMHNMPGNDTNNYKQETTDMNGFSNMQMNEVQNHMTSFMCPSNSSSSTFNPAQATGNNADNISSIVSMLKGTLERKKLCNTVENESVEDSSFEYFKPRQVIGSSGLNQENHTYGIQMQTGFQDGSNDVDNDPGVLQMFETSLGISLDGLVAAPTNQIQMSTQSQEPSLSESSAVIVVSAGFDVCDGSSNSGQAPTVCESSKKQMGNGRSSGNGPKVKAEQGDPTKKRRVERSKKMAEAKEKMTPAIPSDMLSIQKRCENLEKEVRSLKLNLAFMNRKDSEQTKQIEDLQKQNEDLTKEKQRLLEEIERMMYQSGKM